MEFVKYNEPGCNFSHYAKVVEDREFNYAQANAQKLAIEYFRENADIDVTIGIKVAKKSLTIYFSDRSEPVASVVLDALSDLTEAFTGSICVTTMQEVKNEVNRVMEYYLEKIEDIKEFEFGL